MFHIHVSTVSSMVQSAGQETRYSRGSFARKISRHKTPTTESPTCGKHTWTIWNPRSRLFVIFRPPPASMFVDLNFVPHVSRIHGLISLELVPLLAVSVSHELQRQTSALQRNKDFCAGVDFKFPVNSRPYGRTHGRNFSIIYIMVAEKGHPLRSPIGSNFPDRVEGPARCLSGTRAGLNAHAQNLLKAHALH